jgi:hypothetical protein
MKPKIFVFLISIIFLSLGLKAQKVHRTVRAQSPNTAKIARIQTRIMEKRMNLSFSQSEKVNTINIDYLDKVTELQSNANLSQEEKIKQLSLIRETKIQALKQVLDENQFKEYLKLHQELQEQRSKRIKEQGQPETENPDDQ